MNIEVSHEDVDMIELVRVLCRNRYNAALLLSREGRNGQICFREGRIVHATSSGGLQGEAAAIELLTWRSGDLRVSQLAELEQATIDCGLESLLVQSTVLENDRVREARLPNEAS